MEENNSQEMFIDYSEDDECLLCQKRIKDKDFSNIINKALARKHCANLNQFFYNKDINKILGNARY